MSLPPPQPAAPRSRHLAVALALCAAACGGTADVAPRPGASPVLAVVSDPASAAAADLRGGRPATARARLESALAQDPDARAALSDLALTYALEERTDAARKLLEEALAHGDGRDGQLALVNLAELYALEGYLDAASAYLASARAADPARPEPAYAQALLADARGDRAGAQTALRTALAADPQGAGRRALAFLYPEERSHLEALLAEAAGDATTAQARWRELARGRFPALAALALRRLGEEPGGG